MKFKLKSKRLDRLRDLESQIIYKEETFQISHFIDEKTGNWATARINYPKPYSGVLY